MNVCRISILVVIEDGGNQVPIPLTVDSDLSAADIKALMEAQVRSQVSFPLSQAILQFGDRQMQDTDTLSSLGVSNNDMLRAVKAPASSMSDSAPLAALQQIMQQLPGQTGPVSRSIQGLPVHIASDPAAVQNYFRTQPLLMQQISASSPELLELVNNDDPNVLFEFLLQRQEAALQGAMREQQRIMRLNANEFDEDSQRQILEDIQRHNVNANMQAAMEYNPESFASVIMLYIQCQLNDKSIKAFVDSGAQTTIMSMGCAERCGISHLIDRRFSGVAKGVGTAKIVGRVHYTEIMMGQHRLACSVTVLDSNAMEFLLGLDMLKKHQMVIDLKKNCLVIDNDEVPFLHENELPKNALGRTPASDEEKDSRHDHEAADSLPTSATPSAPAAATASTSGSSSVRNATPNVNESEVQTLMGLGFPRESVIRALQACNGNSELAASLLFQS